jgi:hypothetical protein
VLFNNVFEALNLLLIIVLYCTYLAEIWRAGMTPNSLKNGLRFCKDDLLAYSLCILIRFGPTCSMCAVFPTFDILFRKGYIFYITSPHSLYNFIEGWVLKRNPEACCFFPSAACPAARHGPQKMAAAVSAFATVPPHIHPN